jgi:hypothetical protein
MTRTIRTGLLVTAALAAVAAAPLALAADPQPKVIRLAPKKMDGVDVGKAVVVKGGAGPQPHRFALEKLTFQMPVVVALRPVNKGDEVGVKIAKYAWNQPDRQGSTDGELLRYAFRTEGEFQISVEAKKPNTPYRLLVWVGDEMKPELRPVVVKASEFADEEQSSGGGLLLWVIAGALVAIVGLLTALVLRRRPA